MITIVEDCRPRMMKIQEGINESDVNGVILYLRRVATTEIFSLLFVWVLAGELVWIPNINNERRN